MSGPGRKKMNGKVQAAVNRHVAPEPPPGPVVKQQVPLEVLVEGITADPGAVFNLQVKPSRLPHLLVWIPEQEGYQAVFLPIGSNWRIMAAEQAGPQRRLWLPGQPPNG